MNGSATTVPVPILDKGARRAKRARGLCITAHCRNEVWSAKELRCSKCKMREWRAANPLRAAFAWLRNGARRRGISFSLTLEEFEQICAETGYLERRGDQAGDLQLDRIDHTKGYALGNLQVLPANENRRKGAFERHYGFAYGTTTGARFFSTEEKGAGELPF